MVTRDQNAPAPPKTPSPTTTTITICNSIRSERLPRLPKIRLNRIDHSAVNDTELSLSYKSAKGRVGCPSRPYLRFWAVPQMESTTFANVGVEVQINSAPPISPSVFATFKDAAKSPRAPRVLPSHTGPRERVVERKSPKFRELSLRSNLPMSDPCDFFFRPGRADSDGGGGSGAGLSISFEPQRALPNPLPI